MPTMFERGIAAGEALLGTCQDIREVATEDEINNAEFCASLDDVAMRCDTCSWWYEPSLVNDDSNCTDCAEDEKDGS